jgi:hypothetical protein
MLILRSLPELVELGGLRGKKCAERRWRMWRRRGNLSSMNTGENSTSKSVIKSRNNSQKVIDYGDNMNHQEKKTSISASFSQKMNKRKPLALEIQLKREKMMLKEIKLKNRQEVNYWIKKALLEEKEQEKRQQLLLKKQQEWIEYVQRKEEEKNKLSNQILKKRAKELEYKQKLKEEELQKAKQDLIKKEREELKNAEEEERRREEIERQKEKMRMKRSQELKEYIGLLRVCTYNRTWYFLAYWFAVVENWVDGEM